MIREIREMCSGLWQLPLPKAGPDRISTLDGVRSLAVILVIARHTFDQEFFELSNNMFVRMTLGFGWVGVMLFFVLSGYLVGGQAVEDAFKGRFSSVDFLVRRSFRIFPLAYCYLLIKHGGQLGWNEWSLKNFTFTSNLRMTQVGPAHFWTLCVEEQFYFCVALGIPLFLWALPKRWKLESSLNNVLFFVLVLCLFGRAGGWFGYKFPNGAYVHTLMYLDFFLAGILIRTWEGWGARLKLGSAATCLVFSLFFPLAYLFWPFNSSSPNNNFSDEPILYALGYPLLMLWCSSIIFICATQKNRVTKFFSHPTFYTVSTLSYGMYMWQFIASSMGIGLLGKWQSVWLSVGRNVLVSMAISLGFYHFVEAPFLRLRGRLMALIKRGQVSQPDAIVLP